MYGQFHRDKADVNLEFEQIIQTLENTPMGLGEGVFSFVLSFFLFNWRKIKLIVEFMKIRVKRKRKMHIPEGEWRRWLQLFE